MSFKIAYKNIKKSIKDYSIYFFTLILGVAIFYIFNAMDGAQATLVLSKSKMSFIDALMDIMSALSLFVSVILGCLIVYASRFLMKRRKKEFGMYMLLGMSKANISKILLAETLIIGLLSLVVGLIIGIIGAQFMTLLVASMFEANMDQFTFTFSMESALKTLLYFTLIYVFVMVLYSFIISKTKLINLMNANKQNESVKLKKTWISIVFFILSIALLSSAYYKVTNVEEMQNISNLGNCFLMGCLGTFLFFYSISGFFLKLSQSRKTFYYKKLNMFVVRQLHSKVNTAVMSMSVISILLFLTICIFSSGLAINKTLTTDLKNYTPVDVNVLEYNSDNVNEQISFIEHMKEQGVNPQKYFKEYIEANIYHIDDISLPIGNDQAIGEEFMTISKYNEIATLYGQPTYTLANDEYLVVCNYDGAIKVRNKYMKTHQTMKIGEQTLRLKYSTCQDGFVYMDSPSASNGGLILIPDEALPKMNAVKILSVGNVQPAYQEKDVYEQFSPYFVSDSDGVVNISYNTKQKIYENSVGVGAIATFIGLYLGIIFLISSAAVLALKELSESTDNKERYIVLRKIGVDEKMINHALCTQIAIFFFIPLLLGCVHAYFGIQFGRLLLPGFMDDSMISAIFLTTLFLMLIYGGYFLITYFSSKRIIKS